MKTLNVDAVRIKQLANLANVNTIKLSYFDKAPPWLQTAINDGTVCVYAGHIMVNENTVLAGPGDYLVKVGNSIEIKTHDEIMEQYHSK